MDRGPHLSMRTLGAHASSRSQWCGDAICMSMSIFVLLLPKLTKREPVSLGGDRFLYYMWLLV